MVMELSAIHIRMQKKKFGPFSISRRKRWVSRTTASSFCMKWPLTASRATATKIAPNQHQQQQQQQQQKRLKKAEVWSHCMYLLNRMHPRGFWLKAELLDQPTAMLPWNEPSSSSSSSSYTASLIFLFISFFFFPAIAISEGQEMINHINISNSNEILISKRY